MPPQPWKNGGGVTRELLAWPEPASWRVRISVAEVTADGPFSRFEGVQRWFAVLQGDGVRLTVDRQVTELGIGDAPHGFSGEAETACTLLGGPTRKSVLVYCHCPGGATPEEFAAIREFGGTAEHEGVARDFKE